jgi:hypothetical protein
MGELKFSLSLMLGNLNDLVYSEPKCRCCDWNCKNYAIMLWPLKFIIFWILQVIISFAAFGVCLLDANYILVLKTGKLLSALGIGKLKKCYSKQSTEFDLISGDRNYVCAHRLLPPANLIMDCY